MNKKDLDLSAYRDSKVLAPSFGTKTKLQILKNYLQAKEQKYKNIADNAGATAVVSGIFSPLVGISTGIGVAIHPELVDEPTAIALGVASVAGIATSIVSHIIFKKTNAKEKDYKYLKECAEAGIKDNATLEEAREYVRQEDRKNSSVSPISEIIFRGEHHYINPDSFVVSPEEMGL